MSKHKEITFEMEITEYLSRHNWAERYRNRLV